MNRRTRRAAARTATKERTQLRKLSAHLPGGSPDFPILVNSTSVIELRAAEAPCRLCGAPCRVGEHRAELHLERRLRSVSLHCSQCAETQLVYFELQLPN